MEETSGIKTDSLTAFTEEEEELPQRHHWLIDIFIQLILTKPLGAVGGFLVLILVVVAILAPVITYTDPFVMHSDDTLVGPSKKFFFGTDQLGRDVYSRIVYGARLSLFFGIAATALSTTIATIVGILSAFIGGLFDTVVQRIVDAMMSFPYLIIMLTIMALFGPGTLNLILAFGVAAWAGQSRVIRSAALSIKGNEYLMAARAIGCKQRTIMLRHVLPNVAAPIIVMISMNIGGAILVEAVLSFIGFGIPPPAPSWGRMLSSDGLSQMLQQPGLAIFPGISISIAVFGFNMLGDALRDLLDPRLQGTAGGRA
jgi:peptide/nickel transport system permease protein